MLKKLFALKVALALMFGVAAAASTQKDIVDTAVESGSFNTLAKALKAADLVSTLKGKGPFTIFAPTDEAFSKLPEGALENLLSNPEQLKKVLLLHVVPGKVMAADVMKMDTAKTAEGSDLSIQVRANKVMINDSTVTKTDIAASNGVIHVIDSVILPN